MTSSAQTKIRSYKDSDYEAVKRLLREGALYYEPWDKRDNLKRKIKESPGSILVAVRDKEVVGYQNLLSELGGMMVDLVVKKEFRRQGIGDLLMKKGEEFLRKKGIQKVLIWADVSKPDLIEHYKKRGYKPASTYLFFTKSLKE